MGSVAVTHSKTLVAPDSGVEDKVYGADYVAPNSHTVVLSLTSADVGLGNVTNDAQTKAAVVPNTVPGAGQVLVGNAGGTAYAPVAASGDVALASTGVVTVNKSRGRFVPTILSQSFVQVSAPSDTSEDILATIAIPAMGANDVIAVQMHFTVTNSANNKTIRLRMDGISGTAYMARALTTVTSYQVQFWIGNQNATNSQAAWGFGINSSGSGTNEARSTSAVDTSTGAVTVVITGQKALNTETLTLDGYTAQLLAAS